MNRKKLYWILFAIVLWFSFALIAHWVLSCDFFMATNGTKNNSNSYIDYMNAFYVALGALFTGLAFFIAFINLSQQKEDLKKQNQRLSQQISLDVFTDAFGHVLDSENFREAKKYIYSNQFKEDVDTLVSLRSSIIKEVFIKKKNKFEHALKEIQATQNDKDIVSRRNDAVENEYSIQLKIIRESAEYKKTRDMLCIGDFRELKTPVRLKTQKGDEVVKTITMAYERIKYFCDRMEYLGIIHTTYNETKSSETEVKDDRFIILDYFGFDIINTFEKLKPFIYASRMTENKGNPYYQFEILYLLVSKRKDYYLNYCKDKLNSLK